MSASIENIRPAGPLGPSAVVGVLTQRIGGWVQVSAIRARDVRDARSHTLKSGLAPMLIGSPGSEKECYVRTPRPPPTLHLLYVLLPTMVYHIDRLASPDIAPNPGTLEGVRRMEEIPASVARFFDGRQVALFRGAVGKRQANGMYHYTTRIKSRSGSEIDCVSGNRRLHGAVGVDSANMCFWNRTPPRGCLALLIAAAESPVGRMGRSRGPPRTLELGTSTLAIWRINSWPYMAHISPGDYWQMEI